MIKIFIFIFSLISSLSFSSLVVAEDIGNYRLGAGDEIQILVYDEPDLTVETIINDNGNINFPLIGEVSVIGNTSKQVQKLIHDGLKGDYLLNPSVQVDIVTYRPFYIQGEVKSPGAYPYKPGLNVDQAIALGGGLTERASVSKIYLKQTNNQESKGNKVKLTYSVSPGDIITIEQSFF